MPKIRVKHFKDSQLENYTQKSYNTIEGVTTLTQSGNLNSNNKKRLDEKFNQSGDINIELLDTYGLGIYNAPDPFNDNDTLEFLTFENNNTLLGVPAIKLEGKNDFYITTDPYLVGLNEIPTSDHANLNKNYLVSESLVQTPNFIDFDKFKKSITAKPLIVDQNQITKNRKVIEYTPFVEKNYLNNLSQEFIDDSIVYDNETYNVGDQQTINLTLDFSESSDAYLLNTTLFYKSGTKFSDLSNPTPDAVYATNQVNLTTLDTPTSITSHFLPNIIWNNVEKRWEYNVIDYDHNLHLSTYQYNINNNNFYFPNAITNLNGNDLLEDENKTIENSFRLIHDYIENSPVCFTESHDRFNCLIEDNGFVKYNVVTDTYGFPNSSLWKSNPSHSIKLENYLPGDFLVEKVIFEGNLNVKAEFPTKKGNFFNNTQISENSNHDSQLFINSSTFNSEFYHNKNTSEYINTTINFYLMRVKNAINKFNLPKISGYQVKNSNASLTLSSFTESQDEVNPYIDTNFSDLKGTYYYDTLLNNYNAGESFNGSNLKFTPIKNTIYKSIKIDEFNNVSDDRKNRKLFYLSDIESPVDLSNEKYLSIKLNTDYTTDLHEDLSNNTTTKQFKESQYANFQFPVEHDLITHNSISFVKTNTNSASNRIDKDKLNSDVVIDTSIGNYLNIDVEDYDFKIGNKLNKNLYTSKNISESVFGVKSNYQESQVTVTDEERRNIIFYNYKSIVTLFEFMYEVTGSLFSDEPDSFLGMPKNYFVDQNSLGAGDIYIDFIQKGFDSPRLSLGIVFKYDDVINENETFNIDDCIETNDIFYNQSINNLSNITINLAVLENYSFTKFLLVDLQNLTTYNTSTIGIDTVIFKRNSGDSLYNFVNLSNETKAICFIRLLNVLLLKSMHNGYNIITELNVYEGSSNTIRLLNSNIEKQLNYSTEFFVNNQLLSDYFSNDAITDFCNLRAESNVTDNEFNTYLNDVSIEDIIYSEDNPRKTNFFRLIFETSDELDVFNKIQILECTNLRVFEERLNIEYDEEVGILNTSYHDNSERQISVYKKFSDVESDAISRSGKLINKSGKFISSENSAYILKKSDELVVGVNSFSGFNNIISYAKLNNELNITLIGRELHKKEKSPNSESSSITSAIIGSQRADSIFSNKINILNSEENKYILDSILPGIGEIYNVWLSKNITASNTDDFDLYLYSDAFKRVNTKNSKKTNRLIFTTRDRKDDKYVDVVKDWHRTYYMSKYKSSLNEKTIENSEKYFNSITGNSNKTFIFYDCDSYAFNKEYSSVISDSILSLNPDLSNIKNLSFTPSNFILPRHFNISYFDNNDQIIEKNMIHPGVKISYINDDSNQKYEFTKDYSFKLNNSVKICDVYSGTESMVLQYLIVPEACVDSFNIDGTSFTKVRSNFSINRESWCLVISENKFSKEFYDRISNYIKNLNKIDFYCKVTKNSKEYHVYYDETFKLSSSIDTSFSYTHNFYVILEENNISKMNIVIPLSYLNNVENTIEEYTEELTNYPYNIDYSIDKSLFANSTGDFVYEIIPYTFEELYGKIGSEADSYNISGNIIGSNISFYISDFILPYPQNLNKVNPVRNSILNETYKKFKNEISNQIKSGSELIYYDKKLYSANIDYLNIKELIKENTLINQNRLGEFYLNKKIKKSFIYKKKGNCFVKTNNKLVYQISNKRTYITSKPWFEEHSYIDIFGVERDGRFSNTDIRCMLTYDLNENDILRIYDEQYKNTVNSLDKNYKSPYVEINLSTLNPNTGKNVIKYSHYSLDSDDKSSSNFLCYGSPICDVSNKEITNKFLYSYSSNKQYHYPIDKTSGYRFGVFNPNPVKYSVKFNTNHYGMFKDKTYDTQNYSTIEIINGVKYYKYVVTKNYLEENFRFIDEESASALEIFEGSNMDSYSRHFYPFVESSDGSDLSSLYV